MRYRRRCPNCGKSMILTAEDAGQTVLCGACGERVAVPPGFGSAGEQALPLNERDSGREADELLSDPLDDPSGDAVEVIRGDPQGDPRGAGDRSGPGGRPGPPTPPVGRAVSRAPAAADRGGPREGQRTAKAAGRSTRRRALVVAGVAAVTGGLGLVGGWYAGRLAGRPPGGDATAAIAADEAAHTELVKLKSEAEALAVADRLPEAHAKYQALMARAAVRPPTSPLMWDIVERAKTDQDRIYWILLARMDKAERAFGPGTPVLPNMPTPLTLPDGAANPNGRGGPTGASGTDGRPMSDPSPMAGGASATGPTANVPSATGPSPLPPAVAVAVPAPPSATAPTTAPAQADVAGGPATRPGLAVARVGGVELRPVPQNGPVFNPAVLDVQIDTAIRRGSAYLLGLFKDGELPAEQPAYEMSRRGLHAVIVYALLSAGQAVDDPRLRPTDPQMGRLIDKLKGYTMDSPLAGAPAQPVVYARSMRAAALAVYNRPADRGVLRADVDWLVAAAANGAYGPDDRAGKPSKDGAPAPPFPPPPNRPQRPVPGVPPAGGYPLNNGPAPHQPLGVPPSPGGTTTGLSPVPRTEKQRGNPDANSNPPSPATGDKVPDPPPRRPADPPKADARHGLFGWPDPREGVAGPAGPLTDGQGRPIELAHNGERVGPPPPTATGYNPPRIVPQNTRLPGYGVVPIPPSTAWDNFNSLFGLFGVWCGAEAGVPVPAIYWKDAMGHWTGSDLPSGEWGFLPNDRAGTYTTTAGGVAALLMIHDWLGRSDLTSRYKVAPFPPELARAVGWLSQGDNAVAIPNPTTRHLGYDLFSLGWAGRMTGLKYFGSHDWYPELAGRVVTWEHPNGSWGRAPDGRADNAIETAFHVLFLAQGRHPVLMNKLQFDGPWQNRPRDVANAASSLSRTVERPLNWQTVTLDRPGLEWQDAPILFVAGDQALRWTSREVEKVRSFADGGGLVLLHADNGSGVFNRWAAEFCGKLYPQYPLADVPADHPLYTATARVSPGKVKLRGVSNGSRLLVLVSADDVAGAWQRRSEREAPDAYRFLVNLWTYAVGKTPPRPRLDTTDIPAPPGNPAATLPVARVRYDGNWDPEPGAWPRLGRYTHWEADAVPELKAVSAADLAAGAAVTRGGGGGLAAPLAHLTGTAAYVPAPAEAAGLRAYVEAGGVLLVEACGGSADFRRSAEGHAGWLATTFPGLALSPARADSPPLARQFDTEDDFVGGIDVRPYVLEALGPAAADADRLQVAPFGKGYVVYCPLDLSTGLSGSKAWGVAGYAPDHAIGIVKNILIWASTR